MAWLWALVILLTSFIGVEAEGAPSMKESLEHKRIIPLTSIATIADGIAVKKAIDIIKGLFGLQQREDLSYQVKGRVRMAGGGLMPSTLPFDSQGTVSIKELASGRRGPS